MDPEQYLREKAQEVERQARNIRDAQVFDFNYVPDQPIERQEMDKLTHAILKYEHSHIPTNVFIFGSRGCGKTVTAKFLRHLFNDIHKKTTLLYVNVREYNTSFKILAHLLGASPRGLSLSELFERFRRTYTAPCVLILDEIDFISEKDRGKEILYLMSRAPENYMLILVATNPKLLSEVDPMTRSSLGIIPLHFRNYDAVQLIAILDQRAQRGLHTYTPGLLHEISALVTKLTNADVRVAIKTLYYAATDETRSVQANFDLAQRDLVADLICDLNYNNLLVLKAVLHSEEKLAKPVYRQYLKLCTEKGEKAFAYTRWYNNLSYLQSIGLILLVSTKVGRTYTNRIDPLFEESLLQTAHDQKLHS